MSNKLKKIELENAIKLNPSILNHVLSGENTKLAGTQVECAFGCIDFIFWGNSYLYVVELCSGVAGDKKYGKLSRYCSLVNNTIRIYDHIDVENFFDIAERVSYTVVPVIIAPYFDEKLVSSSAVLISVNKNGEAYEFSRYQGDISTNDAIVRTLSEGSQLSISLVDFGKSIAKRATEEMSILACKE